MHVDEACCRRLCYNQFPLSFSLLILSYLPLPFVRSQNHNTHPSKFWSFKYLFIMQYANSTPQPHTPNPIQESAPISTSNPNPIQAPYPMKKCTKYAIVPPRARPRSPSLIFSAVPPNHTPPSLSHFCLFGPSIPNT
ncbi:hypothetical protein DL98DRAFT_95794 [Cadophora sp. DSE1049]|nr:hypothetical protein DL98DRAFT_95794 [Cadophora sp. DSE1049]